MVFRSIKFKLLLIGCFIAVTVLTLPNHSLAATSEISGLLKVDAEFIDEFDGTSFSDIVINRAEVHLNSELSEWITGAIIPVAGGMQLVGETSYNYYFEKEMMHEEELPDMPFTRPWKKYDIRQFKNKGSGDE